MTRAANGKRGEDRAVAALERAGCTVLERNWRCAAGELDIIARQGQEIIFVEVRWRADGLDAALESIGPRKRAKLIRLANAYLATHGLSESAYRIDVAAVSADAIEIIENAV